MYDVDDGEIDANDDDVDDDDYVDGDDDDDGERNGWVARRSCVHGDTTGFC